MNKDDSVLAAFDVYCEMVANDAKPLGLHYPMEPAEITSYWDNFLTIASKHNVELYREDAFPVSQLFPAGLTQGKSVVLIYRGHRLSQYEQWKEAVETTNSEEHEKQEELARRFGRLLGYSPQGINDLLSKNTAYRNLNSFGISAQVTHLYYENLDEAIDFYKNILGLSSDDKAVFKINESVSLQLHQINEDHPKEQPKSTAIALLTDQLNEWYQHIQEQGVPIKYPYKPKEGGPHDGFVAIDPGGYLLEFEYFKQHPENELFKAILGRHVSLPTNVKGLDFVASITWTYHKDLLKMQQFYEEVLGFQLVADQGWTKIYQASPTGFIGLVDERRGMEDYVDTKAVEIEWQIGNYTALNAYAAQNWKTYHYKNGVLTGPERYIYRIIQ